MSLDKQIKHNQTGWGRQAQRGQYKYYGSTVAPVKLYNPILYNHGIIFGEN